MTEEELETTESEEVDLHTSRTLVDWEVEDTEKEKELTDYSRFLSA